MKSSQKCNEQSFISALLKICLLIASLEAILVYEFIVFLVWFLQLAVKYARKIAHKIMIAYQDAQFKRAYKKFAKQTYAKPKP